MLALAEYKMADSTLSIRRPREWFGRFRKLQVILDGNPVTALGIGKTVELIVEPGVHTLQVKMDWCISQELQVGVNPGERLTFVTKSPGLWRGSRVMCTNADSFFEILAEEA